MPQTIEMNFGPDAHVRQLALLSYGPDENTNNGAPCSLVVDGGNLDRNVFWECMHSLTAALNNTEDAHPLRGPEITRAKMFSDSAYPNHAGSHGLAGGEKAYISTIRREDTGNVTMKALREMAAIGLIGEADCASALQQLNAAGIATDPRAVTNHKFFDPARQAMASSDAKGVPLSQATRRLLHPTG